MIKPFKHGQRVPYTVNEAAEYILSDLLTQHLQVLSNMTDEEFEALCTKVTPYLNEEFRIWEGNDALIESCWQHSLNSCDDPARIILNRVKQLLQNFSGYLVIT